MGGGKGVLILSSGNGRSPKNVLVSWTAVIPEGVAGVGKSSAAEAPPSGRTLGSHHAPLESPCFGAGLQAVARPPLDDWPRIPGEVCSVAPVGTQPYAVGFQGYLGPPRRLERHGDPGQGPRDGHRRGQSHPGEKEEVGEGHGRNIQCTRAEQYRGNTDYRPRPRPHQPITISALAGVDFEQGFLSIFMHTDHQKFFFHQPITTSATSPEPSTTKFFPFSHVPPSQSPASSSLSSIFSRVS